MSNETLVLDVADEAGTAALGAALAAALPSQAVVTLDGPLGAGKTRLAQALAAALGIDPRDVVSPTFVLVQEHRGRTRLVHCDAYRLHSAEEFWELGAEEYFAAPAITLIEWSQRVAACLPEERLAIEIDVTGATSRRFRIAAVGPRFRAVVERLAQWAAQAGLGRP